MLLLMMFFAVSSWAQENFSTNMTINYQVNLSNLQIGKPFVVSYTMPAGMTIVEVDSNVNVLGDVDVVMSNISPTSMDVEVSSFTPVPHPMPSFLLTLADDRGQTNKFYTPSFEIPISNDIVSNTNISFMDIEQPYFVFDWILFAIIMIILLIILLLVFMLAIRDKKRKPKENPIAKIDPFEQMDTRLKQLKVKRLNLNEENYKDFFVEISEIVRTFLSDTVLELALETPTRELIQEFKNQKIDKELLDVVTFILRTTDRVKYAKQIFPEDRIDELLDEVIRMFDIVYRNYKQKQETISPQGE